MAMERPQQEVLAMGMEQNDPEKGPVLINLFQRRNTLEVRPGLGQMGQWQSTLGGTGYEEILGSHILYTDFGHLQILTLLRASANMGDMPAQYPIQSAFCLSIYDVTTNTRWEEVLHRHTSENSAVTPLPVQRPCYQTNRDANYAGFPSGGSSKVNFVEYQDLVVFGNTEMGAWAYVPTSFDGARSQQLDLLRQASYGSPYGESSRVIRLSPTPNPLYASTTAYLDTASFPSPSAVCTLSNRVAYASGRNVWFSDIGAPASVASLNFISLGSDQDITAMAESQGLLWIFTPYETYVFQPATGFLIGGGRLTKLSATVGCMSGRAITRVDNQVVFAASTGIYATNGMGMERISDPIKPLFDEGLTAPLGNYYQSNGITPSGTDKPRLLYGWDDTVTLTYEPMQKILFATVPSQNYALTWQSGNWSIWTMESVVTGNGAVGVTANIQAPQFLAIDGRLFCVCFEGASYAVLEWGRGGALDRSVCRLEDNRQAAGGYAYTNAGSGYLMVDAPTRLDAGYVLPMGTTMPLGGILAPIRIVPLVNSAPPDGVRLAFMFNSLEWQPVCLGAGDTATIDAVIPSERLPSRKGWGLESAVPGLAEVRVYSSITGNPDPNGDEIRVYFDGTTGNALLSWTYGPKLNLLQYNLSDLISLPFAPKVPNPTGGLNIVPTFSSEYHSGSRAVTGTAIHMSDPVVLHDSDDIAQPVDYLLRTAQIKDDKYGSQLRLRGAYLRVLTHAQGLVQLSPSWTHGLLNVNLGSDWKDWASQIVDYQGDLQEGTYTTNRVRVKDSNGLMVNRTLEGALLWGEDGSSTAGNYLVDEEEVDTVAISDSIRGESLSMTVYGHMRDRAARLVFDSVRVLVEKVSGARRRGR